MSTTQCGEIYRGMPSNWNELGSREKNRYHSRFTYRRHKARGQCPKCGKGRPEDGYICCRACIDAAAARWAK